MLLVLSSLSFQVSDRQAEIKHGEGEQIISTLYTQGSSFYFPLTGDVG